jgi:hypothetical protein
MAGAHLLFAWLTVGATVVIIVATIPGAIDRLAMDTASRRWIDRAILVQLAAAGAATIAGIAITVTASGPRDPLHFLYAAVVLTAVPVTRYVAHGRTGKLFARWMAVAALVVMGALLRSFMTGR